MLRDLVIAAIRTGVAAVVGLALAWVVNLGVEVPEDFEATLIVVVFGLIVAGYNVVVGFLERKVHPMFGILLGVPKSPAYGAVGTQTPPPRDPNVVNDRGHVDVITILVMSAVVVLVLVLAYVLQVPVSR